MVEMAQKRKRSNLLLWIILGGGGLFFLVLCFLALAVMFKAGGTPGLSLSSNQLAALELTGTITDSREFVEQLEDYGNRPGVRAVVVRIDSPGGGVAATQEIFEAIRKFRAESGKKVVVSMASVAASGGYYVACASDRIFANRGTITGSIGVIAQWYNYGDLLRWARMQDVVIKSGELKDAGSGSRPMTKEEKAYFQALIDDMYGQFVADVARGRNLPEEEIRRLADGRVFTGQEAHENHLIDEIGTYQDAVDAAAKLGGITGAPKLLKPPRKKFSVLDVVLGDAKSALPLDANRSQSHIRFEYLWR
ncbi:MAG: signal peptide peptidase SppA [Acidobacteriota bacterium]|jgi:protease-4|nr:signal peptide peptidase SppA [Acidobacteriota bacterium]NLT32080.1 signal peptide peptidase SppA [Acidobacteriota bacterium]